MNFFNVLTMLGGLALFLYGMHIMGDGLAKMSGGKLEMILEKFTAKPITAVLLGAGVTAVIQSSSATTVMVVGFVNSGIMQLKQAVGIIMGANIGTTITSWILSLTGIEGENFVIQMLKPSSFAPILALIGVCLLLFTKSNKKKDIGSILAGFAILMIGMDTMSGAVKPLAEIDGFKNLFLMFENPVLGVVAGAVLTAIIQSSSALISGIGATKNAKRAAFVHFYFNLIGTVLFMAVFYLINAVYPFHFLNQAANVTGIAVIHSLFNVVATVSLLPFRNGLVKLATWTIRDDATEEKKDGLALLDERFLEKPSFAIAQAKKAAVEMAQDSVGALNKAIDLFKNYDKEKVKLVSELEDKVDHYEDELGTYLMKLSNADLSQKDSQTVSLLLHCIGDFERISDHACNLMDSAKEFHGKKEDFSDKAEEVIDTLNDEVKKKHVKRLRKGKCTIELGFILSDITTNYERIADHCSNIAVCLIQTKEDGYETHEYLDSLKANEDPEFTERYRYYRKKFKLP